MNWLLEAPQAPARRPELHAEAVAGSRKLARVADVPIAGGEGKRGLQPYWQVLHEELYNILQPDPVTSGTPTTLLQIVNLADAAGMPVAFHHG